MNPREITFAGDTHPSLYICAQCKRWHTTAIYACGPKDAAAAARQSAEKCCMPTICECGVAVERPWTACRECRERKMLARATVIDAADYNGPVSAAGNGSWGEGYSGSVDELIEWCDDNDEPVPVYCHPCKANPLRLDAERILENATEEQHEDAGDQIVDADVLVEFIEAWNAKQTCVTYDEDRTRVIVLDKKRFAETLGGKDQ